MVHKWTANNLVTIYDKKGVTKKIIVKVPVLLFCYCHPLESMLK